MTHEELLATPEYWTTKIQVELFHKVDTYLKQNKMTRTDLANKLGVSKSYISQVLNGDFDHRISKFVEIALAVGYVPRIDWEPADNKKNIPKKNVPYDFTATSEKKGLTQQPQKKRLPLK